MLPRSRSLCSRSVRRPQPKSPGRRRSQVARSERNFRAASQRRAKTIRWASEDQKACRARAAARRVAPAARDARRRARRDPRSAEVDPVRAVETRHLEQRAAAGYRPSAMGGNTEIFTIETREPARSFDVTARVREIVER